MSDPGSGLVTQWLAQAREGNPAALHQVFAEVYAELRRIAHRQLRDHGAGRTLNTTGLVHEAFIRLAGHEGQVRDRGHFFALAARVMRQVVVDFARERLSQKRGSGDRGLPLELIEVAELRQAEELLAIVEALRNLAQEHPRQAQVVECRYFAGLTEPETAEALGIGERSVQRDWAEARAWLRQRLR